ncbi:hypothetical protein GSI_12250 [Ganoderma sinense ZZ0214-1]|uniref:Uncharacterized protein n=1 Tax=Ganoderma sinense ZZ0214-1 TaxID=1077348 RepID=A0A2G8RYA4_9APHY|nr:hypothetical protein GSI_12250 [Ganoderma sinense ZZ0214-1]
MSAVLNTFPEAARLPGNNESVLPLPLPQRAFTFDSFADCRPHAGPPLARVVQSPGTLDIATQHARLAMPKSCQNLFPNGERDATRLFNINGRVAAAWRGEPNNACCHLSSGARVTLFPLDQVGLIDEHHVQEYRLTTWTSAVAFTAFVLASARPKLHGPLAFLDAMLPNNVVVWKAWKEAMARAAVLKDREYVNGDSGEHRTAPEDVVPPVFSDADLKRVDKEYQGLLRIFFRDADDAWKAWWKPVAIRSR